MGQPATGTALHEGSPPQAKARRRAVVRFFPRMEKISPRSGPWARPERATRTGNMSWPGLAPLAAATVAMASLAASADQSARADISPASAGRRAEFGFALAFSTASVGGEEFLEVSVVDGLPLGLIK